MAFNLPVAEVKDLYLQLDITSDNVALHGMYGQSIESIHSGNICLWLHRQELVLHELSSCRLRQGTHAMTADSDYSFWLPLGACVC